MPHCHLLLSMEDEFKPTVERVDDLVWARIPEEPKPDDPEERKIFLRELHRCVLRHMIHARCRKNDKKVETAYCQKGAKENWRMCCKRFPKPYSEFTTVGEGNYYTLARPRDGPVVHKNAYGDVDVPHDCQWVVAYNPTLLLALDAHVNVEVVSSPLTIKYCFKYIFKGEFGRFLNCF